jgi:acyl-coenzyme A synthetase/AMP-(fatty) acid ligase
MAVSKLTFGYALVGNLLFTLLGGGTSVLIPERSTCELMINSLQKYRPTIFLAQPRMLSEILAADPNAATFATLRILSSAGEALSPSLFERWFERYSMPILDGFGSTEVGHIFISNSLEDVNPGSTGRILHGYHYKIIDDKGNEVDDGIVGRLCIKGKSLFPCYWNNMTETNAAYSGDWHITKDLFYSKHGYLYTAGRADDMIKTGCGEWIFPQEIESVLLEDNHVVDCAVVGHTDNDGIIRLKALVVSTESAKNHDNLAVSLIDRTKAQWDRLTHKQLHSVEFVPDLPKSPTGKLLRYKLKSTTLNSFSYDC